MTNLLPVDEAQRRILAAITPLGPEVVPLSSAMRRVLANAAVARRSQPPADLSAMDGYAARSVDLVQLPARLQVIETIPAGKSPEKSLASGQAARIYTGAIPPVGADTIVIQENTTLEGETVIVREGEVHPGKHIRRMGSDFIDGETLLSPGRTLNARDVALLAAMDISRVAVFRRPRIAVLATGDELTRPGVPREPAQIVAASLDGLLAQIEAWGGEAIDLGIAKDKAEDIAAAAAKAHDADMLVTLGGASVGDHDLVRSALAGDGLNLDFWRIAMRPGKPLMFGRFREKPFLGLPGNPVSALVCSMLFLKPALYKSSGNANPPHHFAKLPLTTPLPKNDARQDYLRARIVDGSAKPHPVQDSGELRPLSLADILIVRPPFDPAKAPGEPISVLHLENS